MNDHNKQLKSYVDRIQNLQEQIKALQDVKKDLFKEAAGNGFDGPALKDAVKILMEDPKKRQKRLSKEEILETYLHALGELSELPLGRAAIERAVA